MGISLGSLTFDDTHTSAKEKYEEVGGRNRRTITLSGIVAGMSTVASIDARLDAVLDEASVEDYSVALSLRAGRRLMVRRNKFTREMSPEQLIGTFTLELGAQNPFEESDTLTIVPWSISASGATLALSTGGNVESLPAILLTATGTIVNPMFSDGVRQLVFSGTVADSQVLSFDAATRLASLDGVDVTPYTTGLFPLITPSGTTLTYTDDATSSHTGSVSVDYRDRWW